MAELAETVASFNEYDFEDWDGNGGRSIKSQTVGLARSIAEAIEMGGNAAPGGDGSIGFEFRAPDGTLFFF